MALVETITDTAPAPTARQIEARKHLRRGNPTSKRLRDGKQLNKLLRKSASQIAEELVRLATQSDSEQIRSSTGQYILNRAFGMPASAPEDQAVALAVASAPSQFLAQLLQMRTAAIQRQVIDATSTEATLVETPGGEAKLIP